MAPHSGTLAWKISWVEEPGRLQSMGSLRVRLHFHFPLSCIGEGNGNPLQCSCLENPRDGGAWWPAVYGVAQSRTRLKRLSSSSSSRMNWGFFKLPETTMTQGLAGLLISDHLFLSSPDSETLLPWSLHLFSLFLLVSFLLSLISLL